MKRNIVSISCLMFALSGCSSSEAISEPISIPETDYQTNYHLENLVVENINDLSSIGYVSKGSGNQAKSLKRRINESSYYSEDSYFYLAGLVNDEVKDLVFDDGKSSFDIPIYSYGDLGDFIGFDIGEFNSISCFNGYGWMGGGIGSGGIEFMYLLSKKTGKIYQINDYDGASQLLGIMYSGSKVMYGITRNTENLERMYVTIEEQDNQLVLKRSNMLSFFATKNETPYADSFGNMLSGNTIYSYKQEKLETGFDTEVKYACSPFFGRIFTYYQDSFWVLNDSKFEKYDNIIFGDLFPNSHYYYYKDADGNYGVGYDAEAEFENYGGYSVPIYKKFDDTEYLAIQWVDCWAIWDIEDTYTSIKASYEDIVCMSSPTTWYQKLDEYTYVSRDDIYNQIVKDLNEFPSNPIFRDHYFYYIDNDDLIKYDFINYEKIKVDTEGYKITSISEDSVGNLTVVGFDSSFNAFSGYLDENDSVTFTPIHENYGYDVIYMNPIN